MKNAKKYSIIHNSQMTDIDYCFVARDKQKLLDNESTIEKYLDSEYIGNIDEIIEKLAENGIKVYCSEYAEDENEIKNAICIKKYSYRF